MKPGPAGLFGDMRIELGKVGIWRHSSGLTPEVVAEVEALGYGTIWVGGSPPGDLAVVERLLDTTEVAVGGPAHPDRPVAKRLYLSHQVRGEP